MRLADFVLVLPAVYPARAQSCRRAGVLGLIGVVRARRLATSPAASVPIVMAERSRDYVEVVRGWGGRRRCFGMCCRRRAVSLGGAVLLIPALLSAEAAISFLAWAFRSDPELGHVVQDAANVRVMTEAPWMLAPAVALFIVVFGVQLVGTSFDSLGGHERSS